VRPNAASTLNCALCPLLAVSRGDVGLALFTLFRLREWHISKVVAVAAMWLFTVGLRFCMRVVI
jgi:hypothetical protein